MRQRWKPAFFELGAVRLRACQADHVAVADLLPENAFFDCMARMGEGRSEAERERAGQRSLRRWKRIWPRLAAVLPRFRRRPASRRQGSRGRQSARCAFRSHP
ncbi:MAG: hypothetical protein KDJ73_03335 [Notoacmeibacter sp.]|nr:hypothetical protein [Notoacmeibacter sp.]MCC0031547.1 hypothetical protein [Brucellaceae bacterium]